MAQLQQGGSLSGQVAQFAVSTERTSRSSKREAKQHESTEKLLLEKDEEIRKMQAMIQQMKCQLNQTPRQVAHAMFRKL